MPLILRMWWAQLRQDLDATETQNHFPEWKVDNLYLRYVGIPIEKIRGAHLQAKRALMEEVLKRAGEKLDQDVLTIVCAHRAAAYKRADLIFRNRNRLKWIARNVGSLADYFQRQSASSGSGQ